MNDFTFQTVFSSLAQSLKLLEKIKMFKSIFLTLIFVFIFCSGINLGQGYPSLQINGGIISPRSAPTDGPTGLLQFNYSISPIVSFYLYGGYSTWGKNKVTYHNIQDYYTEKSKLYYFSYNQDNHSLIPVYLGTHLNLHTNDLFSSFLELEIGYSNLSYVSYENVIGTDPESGEVLDFYVDTSTGKDVVENLFGVGIGAGLLHPMSSILNLLLEIKLNSVVNENYHGLFSTEGTYASFLLGVDYKL
jgi:hypothetical protein